MEKLPRFTIGPSLELSMPIKSRKFASGSLVQKETTRKTLKEEEFIARLL